MQFPAHISIKLFYNNCRFFVKTEFFFHSSMYEFIFLFKALEFQYSAVVVSNL